MLYMGAEPATGLRAVEHQTLQQLLYQCRLLSYKTNSKLHGTLLFISLAQPFVCSYCYSANIDYSNTFQKFWICSNKQSQYFCSGLSWEDCSQVTVTMVSLFSLQIYETCKCLQAFTRHKALLNGSRCKWADINIIILITQASLGIHTFFLKIFI